MPALLINALLPINVLLVLVGKFSFKELEQKSIKTTLDRKVGYEYVGKKEDR